MNALDGVFENSWCGRDNDANWSGDRSSLFSLFTFNICYPDEEWRFHFLKLGTNCNTHLPKILETHPWETRSWREMSQGRTPWWAKSTIRERTTSGRGRPLTKTPPNWLTPPWPVMSFSKVTNRWTHRENNEWNWRNWWVKVWGVNWNGVERVR